MSARPRPPLRMRRCRLPRPKIYRRFTVARNARQRYDYTATAFEFARLVYDESGLVLD
jgi:hypothetical protein